MDKGPKAKSRMAQSGSSDMVSMTINTGGNQRTSGAAAAPVQSARLICYMQINRVREFLAMGKPACAQILELANKLPKSETMQLVDLDLVPKSARPAWLCGSPTLLDNDARQFFVGDYAVQHLVKIIDEAKETRPIMTRSAVEGTLVTAPEDEWMRAYTTSPGSGVVFGESYDRPATRAISYEQEVSGYDPKQPTKKLTTSQTEAYMAARASRATRYQQQPQAGQRGPGGPAGPTGPQGPVGPVGPQLMSDPSMPAPVPSSRRQQVGPGTSRTAPQGLPMARGTVTTPSAMAEGARHGLAQLARDRELYGTVPGSPN